MDTSKFPVPQMNFVEEGWEVVFCFVCVYVSAFSKDSSRTKKNKKKMKQETTHHLPMAAIKEVIK